MESTVHVINPKNINRTGPTVSSGRGIAIPLVLVVIVLVLLMGFSVIYMARHQLSFTAKDVHHAKLYRLARCGAEIARAQVETFIYQVPYEGGFRTTFGELLDYNGDFAVEEKSVRVESDNLDMLVEKVGGDVSLEVIISVNDIEKLHENPTSDLEDNETSFMLKIESTARSEEAEVVTACAVEGRRMFTHIPPVSKFTLFVHQKGDFRINTILDSRSISTVRTFPIVFHNGQVVDEDISPEDLSEFIQDQGFVYLGGGEPWDINLSTIGNDDELCDTGILRRMFRYPLPQGSTLRSRNFEYYSFPQGVFKEARMAEGSYFLSLFSEHNVNYSSNMNLFGTPTAPSPTVVFGCAYRWFVLEQGLIHATRSVRSALPYLTPFNFRYMVWPGDVNRETAQLIAEDLFDNDYDRYYQRMAQPVVQDYNAGLASFAAAGSQSVCVPDTGLPFLPRVKSNDVEIDPTAVHLSGQKLTLVGQDGSLVYQGHPEQFDVVESLEKKVCFTYPSQEAFFEARERNEKIKIKGVERILGSLTISRPFTLAEGYTGLLLVDGDITISAPVQKGSGHLYLVSGGGDISFTTASPVEAYLAAPAGTIGFPDEFQVLGGVMCRQLENSRLPTALGRCRIGYDPKLDVTDRVVIADGYRVVTQETWTYYK